MIILIVLGAVVCELASAMPQDLGNRDQEKEVDSRYYSGYNNGYYPSSWSSWSSSGYPQQISYNNGYGSNGGYYSGNTSNLICNLMLSIYGIELSKFRKVILLKKLCFKTFFKKLKSKKCLK